MRFETNVAFRFLIDGRTQTLMILLGIAVGISVQIFLSSLITGLQKDLIDKTIGAAAHITAKPLNNKYAQEQNEAKSTIYTRLGQENNRISGWEKIDSELKGISGINNAAPVAESSGFVNIGSRNLPVLIRGVIIEQSESIYKFSEKITKGIASTDANNVLIGKELAKDINAEVGSDIRLTSSTGVSDIFHINGIFDFGNQNIDNTWIFMNLQRAQKFLDFNGNVSSIEIQLDKPFDSEIIAQKIRTLFSDIDFKTWQQTNQQLLTALKSQSSSSDIIQFFIIIAVALGISSVLAVSVMQKSRQIGILKAMGATDKMIGTIFMLQGGILGILGGALGCFMGIGLIQLFTSATRSSGGLTFKITVDNSMILFSIGISLVSSLIASFWPSLRSIKLNPIEVIKNG